MDISQLGARLNQQLVRKLNNANTISIQKWKLEASRYLMGEIVRLIQSGQSPVKGGGGQSGGKSRFQDYSPSYKDQIRKGRYKKYSKKLRPVNLTLTGKMLDSISKKINKNGFTIFFRDEKAIYHNELGAGKSKVIRRMLPLGGQEFTAAITRQLVDILDRLIKSETK